MAEHGFCLLGSSQKLHPAFDTAFEEEFPFGINNIFLSFPQIKQLMQLFLLKSHTETLKLHTHTLCPGFDEKKKLMKPITGPKEIPLFS